MLVFALNLRARNSSIIDDTKRNDYYHQSGSLVLYLLFFIRFTSYGPFTLAIFAAIFVAISSAILRRVNYWRFLDPLH